VVEVEMMIEMRRERMREMSRIRGMEIKVCMTLWRVAVGLVLSQWRPMQW
jgi:hypothetical protein